MRSFLMLSSMIFGLAAALSSQAAEPSERSPIVLGIEFVPGLERCETLSEDRSLFYTSCVRRNFRVISRTLGISLDWCDTLGDRLDRFFASCVRQNFSRTGDALGIRLEWCEDLDEDSVQFFTSCVRRNFQEIGRH